MRLLQNRNLDRMLTRRQTFYVYVMRVKSRENCVLETMVYDLSLFG